MSRPSNEICDDGWGIVLKSAKLSNQNRMRRSFNPSKKAVFLVFITINFRLFVLGHAPPILHGEVGYDASKVSFSVPFLYRGMGMGPEPLLGMVVVERGEEDRLVSRALLETMQAMQMSIVEPPASLEHLIPAGLTWKTGITVLDQGLIQQHNERFPHMALPTDRIYGLQYVGSYVIQNKEFRFRLESHLYHRGIGAEFRPYQKKVLKHVLL